MSIDSTAVVKPIDPRYRFYLDQGVAKTAIVSVTAKVSSLEFWKELSDVKFGSEVQDYKDKNWLVTARIPFGNFQDINSQVFVLSMKISEVVSIL